MFVLFKSKNEMIGKIKAMHYVQLIYPTLQM